MPLFVSRGLKGLRPPQRPEGRKQDLNVVGERHGQFPLKHLVRLEEPDESSHRLAQRNPLPRGIKDELDRLAIEALVVPDLHVPVPKRLLRRHQKPATLVVFVVHRGLLRSGKGRIPAMFTPANACSGVSSAPCYGRGMDYRRTTQIAYSCSPIIAGLGLVISGCTLAASGEISAGVWAGVAGVVAGALGGASLTRELLRQRTESQSLSDA